MKHSCVRYAVCLFMTSVFASALSFADTAVKALYPVRQDGKWGYIDHTGKIVIQPQYKGVDAFSEGLGLVYTDNSDKPYSFVDASGKKVFDASPEWQYIGQFSEGLCSVKNSKADQYGFIDKTGKVAIPFQFSSVHPFSEGLSAVEYYTGGKLSYAFINTKGETVIPADGNLKESFSEGMAPVRVWNAEGYAFYGFMNKTGKIVIPAKYKKVGKFAEGLAFVWDGKQLETIDKTGATIAVLPFKVGEFDAMPAYSCGYAAPPISWKTKGQTQWGFIDKKGQLAFTDLGIWSVRTGFSEKVAWVFLGGASAEGACVDTEGKILFKVSKFSDAKEFKDGIAPVKIQGNQVPVYYNTQGDVIFK